MVTGSSSASPSFQAAWKTSSGSTTTSGSSWPSFGSTSSLRRRRNQVGQKGRSSYRSFCPPEEERRRLEMLERASLTAWVVACLAVGAAMGQSARDGSRSQGHDFGTITQGEKVVHAFLLRNDGVAALTI